MMLINRLFAPPIIVIGMHRSGTSMLTRLFHDAGIFMGNDWGDKNHESRYFRRINDALLAKHNSDWVFPAVPDEPAPAGTFGIIRRFVKPHRFPSKLKALLAGKPWGWKDPRNTFTLPAWLRVFPGAKVIHIYRNGMDVALSLHHRNIKNGKADQWYSAVLENKTGGLDMWERYVKQAFSYEQALGNRMLTLQFEKLIACEADEVAKLEQFTGLPLRHHLQSSADQSRKQRFQEGRDDDLIQRANQSGWMRQLGYCESGLACASAVGA